MSTILPIMLNGPLIVGILGQQTIAVHLLVVHMVLGDEI